MERAAGFWDNLKTSFGALPGLALALGVALGIGIPYVDDWLAAELPVIEFTSEDAARSMLGTIATVTVSVAGLAFSVTLVALTLSSSQLSPRVLRTFQGDRLSQTTLAFFLGTFIYCIVVLLRLGETADGGRLPNLSITLAVLLALTSFSLFAWFLHHIVRTLQPSTVIRRIEREAARAVEQHYPHGVAHAPDDEEWAAGAAGERERTLPGRPVVAEGSGYLTRVDGDALVSLARRNDGLIVQRAGIGDYIVPGDVLAMLHIPASAEDEEDGSSSPIESARGCFILAEQRSALQDPGFPLRQLADIALKGLSPGINDPTTGENAMNAMAASLVRYAGSKRPALVRVDGGGQPRLVAAAPTLDDLVRLGFDEVRVFAAPYPVTAIRLLELLDRVDRAARRNGIESTEVPRQARLLRDGPDGEVPTRGDAEAVRTAHEELHGPRAKGVVPPQAHVADDAGG